MKVALIYRSKERHEYSIEVLFEVLKDFFKKNYEIEDYYLPSGRYSSINSLAKNIKSVKKIKADIYHITGEINFVASFLPKQNTIITIHDFNDLEKFRGIKKIIRYIFWYYIPLHHCRFIGCISHKIEKELVDRFPFTKGKVFYVPNPIGDTYNKHEKFFSAKPTILIVGTRENKNVERIIEATKNVNCKLFIIGELSVNQINLLKKNNIEYKNVFHITDEEVLKAYIDCDIVCFPSLYEGFGRPIIEANAIGRVVITSNMEPMKEVGGGAAFFVDPYSIESITEGIKTVIEDSELRNRLIESGYKNAEKYRAKRIADMYTNIYKKVEYK